MQTPKKVLVVDDDPLTLRAHEYMLRRLGWIVDGHTRSVAAKMRDGSTPDVILSDWCPFGPDMADIAREASIPFVVVTAMPEIVPAGLPVVAKPYAAGELDTALRGAA